MHEQHANRRDADTSGVSFTVGNDGTASHRAVKGAATAAINLLRQWTRDWPELHQEAVIEACESASLGKIRRALRLIHDSSERGPALTVELLSTFNLEPILPHLQLAFQCLPSRVHIQLAPLDNIEGHMSQPTERSEGASARLIIWRVEEVLPEVFFPFTHGFPAGVETRVEQMLQRVKRVVAMHKRHAAGVPLFISTLSTPSNFSQPVFAAQGSAGLIGAVARVNQKIHELADRSDGIYVLDLASWAAREGASYADSTLDFLARQPLSAKGQVAFALFLARSLRPLIVPRRKVLAVDLDHTIWGGVVGEDGVQGLKLGHEFPGNVHLRIQRELLELRNRGVLLVLLSKNNESDARLAFDSLRDMLLKWDDFAVRKIDWNPKHENLRAAAQELNLGLESFAFVDDSDYEREQVRQFLPEVLILNDAADPLQILRSIWETDAFDSLSISEEDRTRHRDYAVREARKVESRGDDLETFLHSLEMKATMEEIDAVNLERVVTMLGKTNQFNLTTRRHSRAEVQSIIDTPNSIALALRLGDKFGEQGIVAVLLALPGENPRSLRVDSFLVSCRALGRGVEDTLWAELLKRADDQGSHSIEAEYVATPRNGIVAGTYDRLGLKRRKHNAQRTRYLLEPVVPLPFPSWIKVEVRAYAIA